MCLKPINMFRWQIRAIADAPGIQVDSGMTIRATRRTSAAVLRYEWVSIAKQGFAYRMIGRYP